VTSYALRRQIEQGLDVPLRIPEAPAAQPAPLAQVVVPTQAPVVVRAIPVRAQESPSRIGFKCRLFCGFTLAFYGFCLVQILLSLLFAATQQLSLSTGIIRDRQNLLSLAVLQNRPLAVRWLLVPGTSVTSSDSVGLSPLHVAAKHGHDKVLKILLEHAGKLDVNSVKDQHGATPVYMAAQRGHEAVLETLIAAKANIDQADLRGVTPLCVAALYGHERAVKTLISARAKVNLASIDGLTPIYVAASSGHLEVVKMLIKARAKVNHVSITHGQQTPLHKAITSGHVEVVNALLAAGADARLQDANGTTSLDIAVRGNHTEMVDVLRARIARLECGLGCWFSSS